MRAIVICLIAWPLASCGLFANKEIRTLRKSPDYRAGYQDGCNSAWAPGANKRRDDTTVRDDSMYQNNRAYHVGWDRGLRACHSTGYTGGAMPGVVPSGPIPDQNPGNGGLARGLGQ